MNRRSFLISVEGKPEPQGSMRIVTPRGQSKSRAVHKPALKAWRQRVALIAKVSMAGHRLVDAPVALRLHFYLERPKSVKRAQPTAKPDLDKLVRGIGDALSGVVYKDDAEVTYIEASKVYAVDREPGCDIYVSESGPC